MRHDSRGEPLNHGREFGTGLRAYLERAREVARERERRELLWSYKACRLAERAVGAAPTGDVTPQPARDLVAV